MSTNTNTKYTSKWAPIQIQNIPPSEHQYKYKIYYQVSTDTNIKYTTKWAPIQIQYKYKTYYQVNTISTTFMAWLQTINQEKWWLCDVLIVKENIINGIKHSALQQTTNNHCQQTIYYGSLWATAGCRSILQARIPNYFPVLWDKLL